jgi:hypothetical protein
LEQELLNKIKKDLENDREALLKTKDLFKDDEDLLSPR